MKKRNLQLIGSIILLVIGVLGILSFIGLFIKGENMTRWIITLLLSVILVIERVIAIIHYVTTEKRAEKITIKKFQLEFFCMVQANGEPDMSRMYIHREY